MAYTRVNWVDNVTPLDQVHLNQMDVAIDTIDDRVVSLESSVPAADLLKVDKDSVVVAATRIVASKLLVGDAQPSFNILGDGKINWGAGGATALDTNLYRLVGGFLMTDGGLVAGGVLQANRGNTTAQIYLDATGKILFGTANDTNLYRASAGTLKTDSHMDIVGQLQPLRGGSGKDTIWMPHAQAGLTMGGDTNLYRSAANSLKTDSGFAAAVLSSAGNVVALGNVYSGFSGVATQIQLGSDGKIYFGTAADTNLYRSASGILKTDTQFYAGSNLAAQFGASSQIDLGNMGGGVAAIRFGSAYDTNLYRSAANQLKTDGTVITGLGLEVGKSAQAQIYFGTANDTVLYRSAAGQLKTDGALLVGQGVLLDRVGAGNAIYWGSAADTNLYRSAAANLKTDGTFWAGQSLVVDATSGGNKLYFGSALDTNLYRSAAGVLKTDGVFYAAGGVQLPSTNVVQLRGELTGAVGGGTNSIRVVIDGANYRIPVFT